MMKSGWLPCITVAAIRAGCANAGANLVNNFDANACRRFSAIPAPRARAVGQHGENLCRVARQIHRVGGATKSHGLAIGRTETSHGVLATRTRASARRRAEGIHETLERRKCLSRNRGVAVVLQICRE